MRMVTQKHIEFFDSFMCEATRKPEISYEVYNGTKSYE